MRFLKERRVASALCPKVSNFGSGGVWERREHQSAETGRVRFITQGMLPGMGFSLLKIPAVELDSISEVACIAELPGGGALVESEAMMKGWCQRQELVLRRVGAKGTKAGSRGFGGVVRFGQLRPGAFLRVPAREPGLCRLGASGGWTVFERAGAAEHFREGKWVEPAAWGSWRQG